MTDKDKELENKIRLQVEKDKAIFMMLIGAVFIVVGIIELIMCIEIVKIWS